MFISTNDFIGRRLDAKDGEIGKVSDILFDDRTWEVRYFVVSCGSWLSKKEVLMVPSALSMPLDKTRHFETDLTIDQVKNSPTIQTDLPVSRQYEVQLHSHYNWGPYWTYPISTAYGETTYHTDALPIGDTAGSKAQGGYAQKASHEQDPHLRSLNAVKTYRLSAADGNLGHVEALVIDTSRGRISHLVVDTKNLWPSSHVLLESDLVREISELSTSVVTDLDKKMIEDAPPYAGVLEQDYIQNLHHYYSSLERDGSTFAKAKSSVSRERKSNASGTMEARF